MSITEIDLRSLKYNFNLVRLGAGGAKVFCVVKSNAYGCGLVHIANALNDFGCDGFVVANFDEGKILKNLGVSKPILVLGRTPPSLLEEMIELNLTQSVFQKQYFEELIEASQTLPHNKKLEIYLKINCGFNRLGFCMKHYDVRKKSTDDVKLKDIIHNETLNLKITGIFAHLSSSHSSTGRAGRVNKKQIAIFKQFCETTATIKNKNILFSLFNSGGMFKHHKMFDVVRIGAALYGIGEAVGTKAVKSVYAEVLQVNTLQKGECLGYGAHFKAKKMTKIAVLDIGYADGYSRMLSDGKGIVFVKNTFCKIIGKVCMNHCFVLLKHDLKISIGDKVELLGNHISPKLLAKKLNTIDYEVYCRLNGAKTIYI